MTPCDTSYRSQCTFSCIDGYDLIGPASRTCEHKAGEPEGYWTGSQPRCESKVRRCPVIVPPENALPSNCGGTAGNLATVGSVCTFYCPHGFNPRGYDKVECQADGTWSKASFVCDVGFERDGEIFEVDLPDQGNGNSLGVVNDNSSGDGSGSDLDNFEWDRTEQGSGSGLGIINEDSTDDGSDRGREIYDADITEQGSGIVLEDEGESADIYFVQQ